MESIRDIEQSLKDMGLSNSEAKTLISKVKEFSSQRDAEEKSHRDDEIKQKVINDLYSYIINLKNK
jgi:hypothetical protein